MEVCITQIYFSNFYFLFRFHSVARNSVTDSNFESDLTMTFVLSPTFYSATNTANSRSDGCLHWPFYISLCIYCFWHLSKLKNKCIGPNEVFLSFG